MYLFTDHLLWLHSSNILNIDYKSWEDKSDRCWLYNIILDLMRNLYELRNISVHLDQIAYDPYTALIYLTQHHQNLLVDTVKNLSDLMLPLKSLGYTQHSSKFVAFCGIISSVIGVVQITNPLLKL